MTVFEQPEDVKVFEGFMDMPESELKDLYSSLNLAMTFKDFLHIQNYFKNEEKRDPSVTEIRVLDTYWSDHCRHTTFQTELKDVEFTKGDYNQPIENTYRQYLACLLYTSFEASGGGGWILSYNRRESGRHY